MREKIFHEKKEIMKKRKAQLFTLDVLLALIPLVIAVGISANAFSGLASQMQSYLFSYDAQRIANDVADTILKTPGYPVDWNENNIQTLGLASVENNFVYNHILNFSKITMLKNSANKTAFKEALKKTSHGKNIIINISASDPDYNVRVMGYYDPNTGEWKVTQNENVINSVLSSAENVFMVERKTRILTEFAGNATFIWNYTGDDIIQSTPTIADIDCDGENEVIVGTNANISGGSGGVAAFEPNGTLMWFYPSGKAYTSSPSAVDLDGDCGLEIIIGQTECPGENFCGPANITAVDDDGSFMWNVTMDDGTWNAPVVADVDYDGILEVIIGAMPGDRSIYVISGNNGTIEYTLSTCRCIGSAHPSLCAAEVGIACDDKSRNKGGQIVADLDRDPTNGLEIIGDTCNDMIFAFHAGNPGSGIPPSLYWSYGPTPKHFHATPAAADIDGDGYVEVIGNDRATLYVFYYNGTLKWSHASPDDKSAPAIADLDASNDGNLEIVVGGKDGIVRAFYNDGSIFWTYDAGQEIQSSPAIADIDDDCALEVVIGTGKDNRGAVSYAPSYLIALNAEDGSELFKETVHGSLVSSPSIGDLDGDGDQEIVVGSDSGNLYAFDVSGYGDGWPSFHQAEASMTPYSIWRTGEWTGSVCGMISGAYSTIEARARITADVKIYVW